MNTQNEFLLSAKMLRITIYLSLAIANIIFGALRPELIVVSASGFAFFGALTLMQLRPTTTEKNTGSKKVFNFDK